MENRLEKRILGKSNLNVSRLCIGMLSFSIYHSNLSNEAAFKLVQKAYELGVNFFDTAELYETYGHIKYILESLNNPESVVISSRSYANTYQEMRKSIEKCLTETGKSSIEIFGLHEVQKDESFRLDAMKALIDAKKEGLVKAISITTHSAAVTDMAAEQEEIDVIMPLINCEGIGIKDGSLKDMENAIKKAKERNKGIYAMKVLAGGHLTANTKQAIEYAVNNSYIDSVAIGMDSIDELLFNLSIFTGENKSTENLKNKKKMLYIEPWCIGCGSCVKACPQNALVIEFGQAKVLRDKCINCGYCIKKCKDFYMKFKMV